MRKQNTINTLKDIIKNNPEGFTIKYSTLKEDNKKGYCVAITNIKGKSINPLVNKVLFMVKGFSQINKNLYLGGWKENGFYYLDLTLKIQDKSEALQVGALFNQLAIFSLNDFETISLNNTKDKGELKNICSTH